MADDLNFQNISTVHSQVQPKPQTIASSTTISPTTFLSIITGTTAVVTVNPPVNGAHLLCFLFTTTTPTAFTTAGNIKAITTPTQNMPMFLVYNPLDGKYYTGEVTT